MAGRAPFIAFEGPEGAGKSVQAERAAVRLRERGREFVLTREPGGTPIGERIREYLLHSELEISPVTELLLFAAMRAAHADLLIRPALDRGALVLTDRYALSTRIYQGVARGLDPADVERAIRLATRGLHPDLYVILDVSPGVGRGRQRAAGGRPDRIEREDAEFMDRVRAGYRAFAAEHEAAVLVDAGGSPEAVESRVLDCLAARFPAWFGAP